MCINICDLKLLYKYSIFWTHSKTKNTFLVSTVHPSSEHKHNFFHNKILLYLYLLFQEKKRGQKKKRKKEEERLVELISSLRIFFKRTHVTKLRQVGRVEPQTGRSRGLQSRFRSGLVRSLNKWFKRSRVKRAFCRNQSGTGPTNSWFRAK